MRDVNNTEDVLDVRDVIKRFEELRDERKALVEAVTEAEEETADADALQKAREAVVEFDEIDGDELKTLDSFLSEMRGYGGDEQWEGDWYPITLIHESYFTDYAQELAEDIGAISRDAQWPLMHIDWEAAAEALKMDYGTAEFDGATYYYRSA